MVDCLLGRVGKSTARWCLVRAGVRGLWFRHLYDERTDIFRTAFAEREEEKFTTEAAEDTKNEWVSHGGHGGFVNPQQKVPPESASIRSNFVLF